MIGPRQPGRAPLLVMLALAGLVVAPAHASDLPKVTNPQEWQDFQDTLQRYQDRMGELQGDVAEIVQQHETDEQNRIDGIYGPMIDKLKADETAQRKTAMERLEGFLKKYPVSPYSANMKFRLADLYFQQADIDYFASFVEYQKFVKASADHPEIVLPEPPQKDYSKSVALYKDILANNQDFENLADTYYMLGWCYNVQDSTVYDTELARGNYEAIIGRFPGTEFANDANMALGEYWFDLPNPTKNTPTAISYYKAVLADGEKGRNYDKALYKLGWSEYKLNHYDAALADMVTLLDFSDKEFIQTGKPANTRPEAIKYLAISYSDMGLNLSRKPIDLAVEHLNKVGDRPWEHEELETLATVLVTAAKLEDAIDVWAYMQKRWPLDPKNPIYQHEIALAYLKLPAGADHPDSDAAMAALSANYSDDSPWFAANRTNADAIAAARDFIQESLGQVATTLFANAQNTGQVADFAAAAAKFKEWLDKYPFGNSYNDYEFYYASCLYSSNQFDDALAAYAQVLKNEHSPYQENARYQIMQARRQQVLAKYGKAEDVPQGQTIDKTVTSDFGKSITVYHVSDEQKAYMASIDDVLARTFTSPDVAPLVDKSRPALTYLPGQILFNHGDFVDARPRLQEVVDKYPQTKEAVYSAGLLVDMSSQEGDLEKVSSLIDEFTAKHLGPNGAAGGVDDTMAKLKTIQEQAQFKLAHDKADKGDHIGSSKAFLAFIERFPASDYIKDALYNAANQADVAGDATLAISLFEQYVAQYPTDDKSEGLSFRIADTYAQTLNLPKAIQNYDYIVKNFPDSGDAKAAMYNSAFFKVGVGDHKGAALEYEQYANKYGDAPDAEQTYWAAGDQWEIIGENDAFAFYNRYLDKYGASNPDHAVEALYKVAKIQEKRPGGKAPATWAKLQDTFRSAATAGKPLSQKSRAMAAEGAVSDLTKEFDALKTVTWSKTDEKKNVDYILNKDTGMPSKINALTNHAVDIVNTYSDYDSSQAAQYFIGMSRLSFADALYNVPVPKEIANNPDLVDEYNAQLDRYRLPFEDQGKKFLIAALDKARTDKRWSSWNSRMLSELNARYPSEFPSERTETRGPIDPGDVPLGMPTDDVSKTEETP